MTGRPQPPFPPDFSPRGLIDFIGKKPERSPYRPIDFIGKNPERPTPENRFLRSTGTFRFFFGQNNGLAEIVPVCRSARNGAVRNRITYCNCKHKAGTLTGTRQYLRSAPPFLRTGAGGWDGTIIGSGDCS